MHTILDLFAGAGGLTRGFIDTGRFRSLYAVELNDDARQSYILNFHQGDNSHVFKDITDVTAADFPQRPDVVIGGPPCQDFTQLTAVRQENDRRRNELLWQRYTNLVLALQPKVFVIENVPNLLTDDQYEERRNELFRRLRAARYNLAWGVLTASHFGVPQARRRAFIIGTNTGRIPHLPFPTLETVTAWERIRDLADMPLLDMPAEKTAVSGPQLHIRRHTEALSRLRSLYVLPDGNRMHIPRPITIKSWVDKLQGTSDGYGRVFTLRPSSTIRCEGFKPEKGRFLHPYLNRPLTLAEMAALQTFPDNHVFYGSYSSIAHQIGNAVPPLLARKIAECVLGLLEGQRISVAQRPANTPPVHVAGSSASQRTLNFLRQHVGQPVQWWQLEDAVQSGRSSKHPDWGTPLEDLKDIGYAITVGNGTNGLRPGEYQLDQETPLPASEWPAVKRLFGLVSSRRGHTCEHCGNANKMAAPALIRRPDHGGLLLPDNVEVLCADCRSTVANSPAAASRQEKRVLDWISRYRHYAPTRRALGRTLNITMDELGKEPSQGALPTEIPPDKLLHLVTATTQVCALCDHTGPGLKTEFVRPREAGGLSVEENVWVLCESCQLELDEQQIKVPAHPEDPPEVQKAGRTVKLRERFADLEFLTPAEAAYVNWLSQYKQDPVILRRATMAFLNGFWE